MVFTVVLAVLAVEIGRDIWKFIFSIFLLTIYTSLTFIAQASIYHIQKHSKSVNKLGIKTDSRLMTYYGICLAGIVLVLIAHLIIGTMLIPIS